MASPALNRESVSRGKSAIASYVWEPEAATPAKSLSGTSPQFVHQELAQSGEERLLRYLSDFSLTSVLSQQQRLSWNYWVTVIQSRLITGSCFCRYFLVLTQAIDQHF